ncbi:uncharacterized protein LOC119652417 isoform X3 [Hermetia illucens]|uniref:uncharacterized protein LOC119652417 isoform X3 n=1 Tax=Hermetia illucens TaxID=343691 RepID=UPI0018CC0A83|nr:uncharacterized protein LOC119652417 isoform X3 [Hermetia illucens]
MSQIDYNILLDMIRPLITKRDTVMREAIPAEIRLAITLRYLATGDSYASLSFLFKVSTQSISKIVPEVAKSICSALKDYIKDTGDWRVVANNFDKNWNFPHCCGAMDGKHVLIRCPQNSGSTFFNYKGTFSIVLFGVVDADYCFTYVNVGYQGRISDGGVFKNTEFGKRLEKNQLKLPKEEALPGRTLPIPYGLVADDAFPLTTNIMKPFPGEITRNSPNSIFNYRLSRARRIVENAFGLLSAVFRIFRKPLELTELEIAINVVLCCIYLHNLLRKQCSSRNIHAPFGTFDSEDASCGEIIPGSWRKTTQSDRGLQPLSSIPRKPSNDAKEVRNEFQQYFLSEEGSVQWQDKYM